MNKEINLTKDDLSKLAKAFKWLIDEDRVQNPNLA